MHPSRSLSVAFIASLSTSKVQHCSHRAIKRKNWGREKSSRKQEGARASKARKRMSVFFVASSALLPLLLSLEFSHQFSSLPLVLALAPPSRARSRVHPCSLQGQDSLESQLRREKPRGTSRRGGESVRTFDVPLLFFQCHHQAASSSAPIRVSFAPSLNSRCLASCPAGKQQASN